MHPRTMFVHILQLAHLTYSYSKEYQMDVKNLRVNGKRLREAIEASAKIGATANGGLERCAATDEDRQGRELLMKWFKDCGVEVTVDEMGNMFAVKPGRDRSLGAVMTGSHFDTQKPGGRFDGILGVIGGIEVLRVLVENNIELERDFIVTNWTNEEGGWYAPACMGSGVWVGNITKEWAYDRPDRDGKTKFGDELERIGYKGDFPADHKAWNIHAAYELHIEQGPQLYAEKLQIGAPKGILCLHWYDVYLEGAANQVGPTPMEGRHDALLAFSEMNMTVDTMLLIRWATWYRQSVRYRTIPTPVTSFLTVCTSPSIYGPGMMSMR